MPRSTWLSCKSKCHVLLTPGHQNPITTLSRTPQITIQRPSGSHQEAIKGSSGDHRNIIKTSSGHRQEVIEADPQEAIRSSSGGHHNIIKTSSKHHHRLDFMTNANDVTHSGISTQVHGLHPWNRCCTSIYKIAFEVFWATLENVCRVLESSR